MKIIAVVGTGSGCGKTTVACRILRALPGLGAVKISPRDGVSRVEWGAGEPGKDTDLYAGSGAVQVARIVGPRALVGSTWALMKDRFAGCRGVVIEGTSAPDIPGERFIVLVVGETRDSAHEERIRTITAKSDIIIQRSSHFDAESFVAALCRFLGDSAKKEAAAGNETIDVWPGSGSK